MNNNTVSRIRRNLCQVCLLVLLSIMLSFQSIWAGQATTSAGTTSTTKAVSANNTSSKNNTGSSTKAAAVKKVKKVSAIDLNLNQLVLSRKASRKLRASLSYKTVTVSKKKAAAMAANPAKIVWTSKNKKIATVNVRGKVTGLKKGTTLIKATVKGTKLVAKCRLIIGYPVTSIQCETPKITLDEGDSAGLPVIIKPNNASVKELSFSSSDAEIADVDKEGNVTGKKAGKVTITIASKDGSQKKASVSVTVREKNVSDQKLEISKNELGSIPPLAPSLTLEKAPKQSKNARAFCEKLETYSAYLKANGKYFYKKSPADVTSFAAAKKAVEEIKKAEAAFVPSDLIEPEAFTYNKIGLNCASVAVWALKELKYIPDNGNVYGALDGFHFSPAKLKDSLSQYAEIKTIDPLYKLDIVTAGNNGYLAPGDIISIAIGSINHTCIYAGQTDGKVMVYESGGIPYSNGYSKVGCGPLNYSSHKNYIVTGIIRIK